MVVEDISRTVEVTFVGGSGDICPSASRLNPPALLVDIDPPSYLTAHHGHKRRAVRYIKYAQGQGTMTDPDDTGVVEPSGDYRPGRRSPQGCLRCTRSLLRVQGYLDTPEQSGNRSEADTDRWGACAPLFRSHSQ